MVRPLVVVDVQPAYTDAWSRLGQVMQAVNDHDGPVHMLVNAEGDGLTSDTVDDCRVFWLENGMDEAVLERVRIVDKGYGHLRGWMDNGAADEAIVAVLRAMLSAGVHDSRDLGEDAVRREVERVGEEFEDWMLDEPLSAGWLPTRGLQDCLICGGAADECLKEVELMLAAHCISPVRIDELVYYGNESSARPSGFR